MYADASSNPITKILGRHAMRVGVLRGSKSFCTYVS